MLASFRRLSKSAVGTSLMVIVLLMILAGFAMQDIRSVFSGGAGLSKGTLVKVGDEELTERDLSNAMRRALNQARQENPEASYATLANQFDPILGSLIDERALLAFADDHGFALSKRLIDKEIAELPQNRGLNGKFSETAYRTFLQQQQMTDADVRRLITAGLTQRLVLAPAAVDARIPVGVARNYAAMLLEGRQGQLVLVPTKAFRAGLNPSDGDIQSFYAQNRQRYTVGEQRVIRIAKIGPESVANVAPSDAEIAAYYKANQATYGGAETRVISQAVVQDKKQADAIAARARAGAAFAAAAAPFGLSAEDVSVGPQDRAQFAGLAGEAVANSAFTAANGAIVGPIRSDLGWHVIKIDEIRGATGKSLAQVRGEIAAQLATNKRKEALTELVTKVEDQIDGGASFAEAVGAAKLPVTTTPPINSGGASRKDPAYRLPAELAPVVKAGFAMMPDDDPEVVTLPNEAGFAVVAVDSVIEAAPAPLAEIKDQVREDWIHRKASDRARAIASQIAAKVAGGMAVDKAVAEAGVPLPPAQEISARRIQIAQANPDAVAPLRMLFSLTEGKSRLMADPKDRGFFIIKTNKITPGNAITNPLLIAQTQTEFQRTVPDELGQQLLAAMKADQGVKRDEKAIQAAKRRITGADQ
ncbi:peptidyl-prolyl cis-trans isomerase [Sphingomonas sp. G124]|uniref:Parvulin-like PPIase n=1 Tax=Sphingomonas cremea TaxID=2904799 RepID=A0A9X1QM86_9SPHN|nr:peptidyl-prolyl cis-trans isomerase [Sphingomonas cremea]MCF2513964.1 peptidyl-prolyl cis-trans isomerase [Sphingomonas cremea]